MLLSRVAGSGSFSVEGLLSHLQYDGNSIWRWLWDRGMRRKAGQRRKLNLILFFQKLWVQRNHFAPVKRCRNLKKRDLVTFADDIKNKLWITQTKTTKPHLQLTSSIWDEPSWQEFAGSIKTHGAIWARIRWQNTALFATTFNNTYLFSGFFQVTEALPLALRWVNGWGWDSGAPGYFRWFLVSGLEWMMHSASFIRVLNALPSIWVPTPRSSGSNELRTVHIKCSHVPPMWLEWVYSSQMVTTHNHSPQDNHINVPDLIIRKLQSFCFMHLQSLFVDHSEVVWLDPTSWGYDSRQLLLRRCSENWLYTSAGHASKDNSITLYLTFFSWSEMVQRSQPHSMKRAVMARCDCKANLPFCELGGFPATFYRLHTEKYNLI